MVLLAYIVFQDGWDQGKTNRGLDSVTGSARTWPSSNRPAHPWGQDQAVPRALDGSLKQQVCQTSCPSVYREVTCSVLVTTTPASLRQHPGRECWDFAQLSGDSLPLTLTGPLVSIRSQSKQSKLLIQGEFQTIQLRGGSGELQDGAHMTPTEHHSN